MVIQFLLFYVEHLQKMGTFCKRDNKEHHMIGVYLSYPSPRVTSMVLAYIYVKLMTACVC